MAALLDKGSASVSVEPVPVTHLFKKRKAVLADGHHLDVPDCSGANFIEHRCRGRHVSIFESHPHHPTGNPLSGRVDDSLTVLDSRAKWLFNHDVEICCENIAEHIDMGHVRCHDDNCINQPRTEHVAIISELNDISATEFADSVRPNRPTFSTWIGDGSDTRSIKVKNIFDVFNTHHPSSDDAVADSVRSGRC